ncbi:DNA-binding transcriptional activator of the SARP family [Amycolatopsis sacchari]|uniref:DNA-binding transcriptional activator of the SARP family n=1 Tax=Amycolatopsis sacchari TaxID=115433 RepID=A0A1I4D623_9PSEU|nr:transcriptional regulator [Amycolatopsis sacchari]SFK89184.1 DNA-binding transcriptional activator of the SARP family [Amycolatopsis sacchari]
MTGSSMHTASHVVGVAARMLRGLLAALILLALLCGLPWALVRLIGWPLPDHLPTLAEVQGVLFGPMTATFLLDFLACVAWVLWALFVADVARYAVELARDLHAPDVLTAGPLRRITVVLVGAVLIAVLGHRLSQGGTAGNTFNADVVATAEAKLVADKHDAVPPRSVVVLAPNPETGVHDSLWRIAQRTLGDGSRWPEIFELNRGKPQPGGRVFDRPSLIFPGEEFELPSDTASTPHVRPPAPAEQPAPRAPHPPPVQDAPPPHPAADVGFRWGDELFVGLGLASAVSAALVLARCHRNRRYRPGSGDRTYLPVAPVVYQLRLAHLRATQDDDGLGSEPPKAPVTPLAHDGSLPVGIRDGREMALDLAVSRGLGLIGEGAAAAARALLVSAVAATPESRVICPAEDAAALLGRRTDQDVPPANFQVVADIEAALDELEAETLARARQATAPHTDRRPPVVLVARSLQQHRQRLQAILDNGSDFGVTGLLLGQWPAGITAYVRGDGTVSATNPGPGERLRGTSMFHLGEDHLEELLTLLRQARGPHENDRKTTSARESGLELLAVHSASEQTDARLEILGPEDDSSDPLSVNSASPRPHTTEHQQDALPPLRITVLGPVRVWWRPALADASEVVEQEVTSAFQPRVRELLVFLALHPDGVSREALIAALWPTSPSEKTTNALNTSFSRLRRAVGAATGGTLAEVVLTGEGRYRLNPDVVEVDYHRFAAAVAARRAATSQHERTDANRRAVECYTGSLADGMSTDWIETAREAIRRDAIDAVAALARALVEEDPLQTMDLLEMARAFDPHNELIYRDIMRLQERLGQLDAIPRTLALLTTRLAEVDDRPSPQAIDLAERLQRRHDAHQDTAAPSSADRGYSKTR